MTTHDVVRFVFGDLDDTECDHIVWSCTGWSEFWSTDNPAKEFYYQLDHAKRALDRGFTIDDIFEGKDQLNHYNR